MQITSININSTNKTSIYSNFSNSINFKGNKKSEKIDAETSKPSFLMQMGQRKAKKLELALPVIQKKADYSTKCIKGLNFPIDGKFEGHPDNTYRRAIAILSNDLMHEITDRGTPLWKVQRILEDEVCCGEDGKSNLEEKRDFLYEHLSDNETFETYRLFSDCDNPHTMTATFAKDGITIEKKSLSGDIENLEYSPEGRLLHYKRKDAREMFLGKPVFVMEYAYDEEADTAIYVQRGNRYNDSSQHIFKDSSFPSLFTVYFALKFLSPSCSLKFSYIFFTLPFLNSNAIFAGFEISFQSAEDAGSLFNITNSPSLKICWLESLYLFPLCT